jgi:hypothetical protein
MSAAASERNYWKDFLNYFNRANEGRRTRLGVFENPAEVVTDYWIENGLPFDGIDIESKSDNTDLYIRVGSICHTVNDVKHISMHLSRFSDEDGIDISSSDGRVTLLRFEN